MTLLQTIRESLRRPAWFYVMHFGSMAVMLNLLHDLGASSLQILFAVYLMGATQLEAFDRGGKK